MAARDTPLDPRTLKEIVEGTAAETGEKFFDALVKHLARATGKKCGWVTEWLEPEQRLRATLSRFERREAGPGPPGTRGLPLRHACRSAGHLTPSPTATWSFRGARRLPCAA